MAETDPKPPSSEPAAPAQPAAPAEPASSERKEPRSFSVDLSDGLDEALEKLKERATHYYKKSQHTQVRIKFRGKEMATLPLGVLVAMEAATFWWIGPWRVIVGNALGKTFLDVEFINEADNSVAAGKQRLLDGELDEALARFREALTMDRDHPGAYLNLGIGLKLKGEREAAIEAFEKALSIDPDGETGKEARRQIDKMKGKPA